MNNLGYFFIGTLVLISFYYLIKMIKGKLRLKKTSTDISPSGASDSHNLDLCDYSGGGINGGCGGGDGGGG